MPKKEKISIVTPGYGPVPAVNGGAVETLISYIVDSNEKEHQFDIDLYTIDDDKLSDFNFKFTNLIRIKKNKIFSFLCKGVNFVLRKLKINFVVLDFAKTIVSDINKKECSKIVVENNMLLYKKIYKSYAKKHPKCKFYFHLHNDIGSPGKTVSNAKFIAKTADEIIFVSNAMKKSFMDKTGVNKGVVLYNSVDFNLYNLDFAESRNDYRSDYNIPNTSYNYLYIGRIYEGKGLIELIRAFDTLAAKHQNVSLAIVGFRKKGNRNFYERKVLDLVSKSKADIRVYDFASADVVRRHIVASDCVVIPSVCNEAFGVVALEAMAMKKTIISTNAGGLIEPLDEKSAVIIDRNDMEKNLYDAMKKVCSHRKSSKEMADYAYKRVHEIPEFDKSNYFGLFCRAINKDEKKVGIVTLNGYCNFGNRLQNYALTKALEERGCKVETIWSGSEINLKSKVKQFIIEFLPYDSKWKREKKFLQFTQKYIKKTDFLEDEVKKYDILIAGSDQVWNYESVKNNVNYLMPFSGDMILTSYAASLGNADFPNDYVDLYKKYLKNYDYISVREPSAKKILVEKVGINSSKVGIHLDPVFLLSNEDWASIEKEPVKLGNRPYVLCCFLGGMNLEYIKAIEEYANSNNLKIVDIMDKNDDCYICGPEEFVYLIHNAEMICTDSFHTCVFSFIFNKPFVVFRRDGELNKMYSRIEDFLKMFGLMEREFNGHSISKDNIKNSHVDSSRKILDTKKREAFKYIDNILSSKKGAA